MDKELIQLSKINSGFWGFGVLGFWGFVLFSEYEDQCSFCKQIISYMVSNFVCPHPLIYEQD